MSAFPSESVLPSRTLFLAELGAMLSVGRRLSRALPAPVAPVRTQAGPPVLIIPGFLSNDRTMRALHGGLAAAGFRPIGWGAGTNLGARADTLDRLVAVLEPAAAAYGRVALVGWSLGGIFARELAKRRPDLVDRVVTLGSPFSGDPRANHAWRLYERVAGHPVDRPPVAANPAEKPPVPTWAIWSPKDGIVSAASARGAVGEADHVVELGCRHMHFPSDPRAIAAVVAALEA